jgi:DNA primase
MAAHENGIDFKAIRAAHPLVPFLQSRGFEVQRSGSSGLFECVCPLHNESTPSFKIYPDQHAYCYGCGWYGDVTSLCAALDGATKKETAFKLLGGIGGPIWTAKSNQVDQIPRREKPAAYRLTDSDRRRMAAAAQRLAKSDQLIECLVAERPEWVPEAIRGAALDGDLGIEDNTLLFGYTHGIKARKLGQKRMWWLCGGPGGQCWRQSLLLRLPSHQPIRFTEGETDALTLLSIGKEEPGESLVLALAGASIMPHPAPFKDREIVIIPDPDEAGAQAERRLRKLLEPVAHVVVTISPQELLSGRK